MERDSIPLWKLVLGVALGVLLADAARMAFAALALGALVGSWGVSSKNPGKLSERLPVVTQPAPLPALDGPVTARARGVSRACVGGTIVDRQGNGWAQDLRGGRPQPCRATSQ